MRSRLLWMVLLPAVVLLPGAAVRADEHPLKGVALVIGESNYRDLNHLDNADTDARNIAEMLDHLGFEVSRVLDKDKATLAERIDRFIADAAQADIALIYYSGHGVEAGGQNFLVPIDADVSSPAAAGQSFIPVQPILERLARTVPLTVTLLDACRSDPFPAGMTIELPDTHQIAPVSEKGLAAMRGPAAVARAAAPDTTLGMVIGFAAGPGQAALDGPSDGDSPYAAALLKHFGAGGYSFGDVMTMVSEEVYLKTGGEQLPWTNSSLTRVLSFGSSIAAGDADEAAIADGRRKLLLSIRDLSDTTKSAVEATARSAGVPMDALYGLLASLGSEVPNDPHDLEALLRDDTIIVRKAMADEKALQTTDPEVTRLSQLAQRALAEGEVRVSVEFWNRAKARVIETDQTLDALAGELTQRKRENGAVFEHTAQADALAGDFRGAADNYQLAYAEVKQWSADDAALYHIEQADALKHLSMLNGDSNALRTAISIYRDVFASFSRDDDPELWAAGQHDLGLALNVLGEREPGSDNLRAAIEAFTAALDATSKQNDPHEWAVLQDSIATAYVDLAAKEGGGTSLDYAVGAYQAALGVVTKQSDPDEWARLNDNLGVALVGVARRTGAPDAYDGAIAAIARALEVWTATDNSRDWANAKVSLGVALEAAGRRRGDAGLIRQAVTAFKDALTVDTETAAPLPWAGAQTDLGMALDDLGDYAGAIAAFEAALRGEPREMVPLAWAGTKLNLALSLHHLGATENGTGHLTDAVAAFRDALSVLTPEGEPLQWATTQNNFGVTLRDLAQRQTGTEGFPAAAGAFNSGLGAISSDDAQVWGVLKINLGRTYLLWGSQARDPAVLAKAAAAFGDALTVRPQAEYPVAWAEISNDRAWSELELGLFTGDVARMQSARETLRTTLPLEAAGGGGRVGEFANRLGLAEKMLAVMQPPVSAPAQP